MLKTRLFKSLSFLLCIVLIAAMALFATGCNDTTPEENTQNDSAQPTGDVTVLGEGATKFTLLVTDKDGNETWFEINTDKDIVGEALSELGIISGEEGPYGLYIKSVNGITADYNTDGTYWSFYIGGEYATSGVDKTNITPGEIYSLKVEK